MNNDLPLHFGPAAPTPINGFVVKQWESKDETDARIVVQVFLGGSDNQSQAFATNDAKWLRIMAIDLLRGAEVLDLAEARRARS